MTGEKQKSHSRKKIEEFLNSKGFLTLPQYKRLRVKALFKKKFPIRPLDTQALTRQAHELSISEWNSMFADEALRLTKHTSAKAAAFLLSQSYYQTIIEALDRDIPGIHLDALEHLRFKPKYMKRIRAYCSKHKVQLS